MKQTHCQDSFSMKIPSKFLHCLSIWVILLLLYSHNHIFDWINYNCGSQLLWQVCHQLVHTLPKRHSYPISLFDLLLCCLFLPWSVVSHIQRLPIPLLALVPQVGHPWTTTWSFMWEFITQQCQGQGRQNSKQQQPNSNGFLYPEDVGLVGSHKLNKTAQQSGTIQNDCHQDKISGPLNVRFRGALIHWSGIRLAQI